MGAVIGSYTLGKYIYITVPKKQAEEMAKKQKEEMEKLVRSGKVVSVSPEEIKLKVEKGGGDIGKTITLKTTEYTNIQIGMMFINKSGEKVSLKDWLKEGDDVNALVKDNRILALHRELRPGEKQPNLIKKDVQSGKQSGN